MAEKIKTKKVIARTDSTRAPAGHTNKADLGGSDKKVRMTIVYIGG